MTYEVTRKEGGGLRIKPVASGVGLTLKEAFIEARRLAGWKEEPGALKPIGEAAKDALANVFLLACYGLSTAALAKMAGWL